MAAAVGRDKNTGTYYEQHHIMPDFMFERRSRPGPKGHILGDPNDPTNLVLLTPREHFIAHVLLVKIHASDRYRYSCVSALQFFFSKVMDVNHPRYSAFNATHSRKYEKYRTVGLKALSEKAKGQIVVKDATTGERIGKVPVTHANVVAGIWVHHSKGMVPTERMKASRAARAIIHAGMNNPNARPDCTSEQLMKCLVDFTATRSRVYKKEFILHLKQTLDCSERIIVSRFGNFSKFVERTNIAHGLCIEYDPYYRLDRQKGLSVVTN